MSADNVVVIQQWKNGWTVKELGYSNYCATVAYYDGRPVPVHGEHKLRAQKWFKGCKLCETYKLAVEEAEKMEREICESSYLEYGIEVSPIPLNNVEFVP